MKENISSVDAAFTSMKAIYFGLTGFGVLYAAISIFLNNSGLLKFQNIQEISGILSFISIVATLTLLPLAFYVLKKKIKGISPEKNTLEKVLIYRIAWLTKVVMIDGAYTTAITFFLITGNTQLLFIALIGLGTLVISIPTKSSILNELGETAESIE